MSHAAAHPIARTCLMFQADWQKNKWKGAVFVLSVVGLGTYVPWFCLSFAQRKAGVWK